MAGAICDAVLRSDAMNRVAAVLLTATAMLAVAVGTADARAARVVTSQWKASYTLAADYSNTWNEQPEQYCPGVQWKETAGVSIGAAFPKVKIKLQSGTVAVAKGASFPGPDKYSAAGNWFPDLQCSEAPRQASCSGVVDNGAGGPPIQLVAQIKGGKVYFHTGVADGLAERDPNSDCMKDQQTAGPYLGFGLAIAPWKLVTAKIPLKELAKKNKIHMFMKADQFPSDYDPVTCQKLNGCSAKLTIVKSDLTLTRIKK
jgi:hypothetical protein